MAALPSPRVGEVVGAAAVVGSAVSRAGQIWAKRCSGWVGMGRIWPFDRFGVCGGGVAFGWCFFLGLHFGGFRCMAVAYFDADAKQGKS